MALGDGIRRNVATISQEERDRFINAVLTLDSLKIYPDGVTYWDKQEETHKNAHAAGQDVHAGPAFVPWHRELCNRLEGLLREVDPLLSLHYWDWTTDPRVASGGRAALFTANFMGRADGNAGAPLSDFESTEISGDPLEGIPGDGVHDHIWRNVNNGLPGAPGVSSDQSIVTAGDGGLPASHFPAFLQAVQAAHNAAHGYIGGTIGRQHFSFHEPFVFLLHSNQDRLWAMWQLARDKSWRLDPAQVYGSDGNAPSITGNLEPWSGGSGLRPWMPPDNQQLVKNCKHPSVVVPPKYDTNPSVPGAGDHFYTISAAERDNAIASFGYQSEGIACYLFASAPSGIIPLFRLLNPQNGDHFYTASLEERDNAVVNLGFQAEGIACHAFAQQSVGTTPIFRLLHPESGDHFYTTSAGERDNAVASFGYQTEGVACYAFDTQAPGTSALYRLLNAQNGDHFYTVSVVEQDNAVAQFGYHTEGIACYLFASEPAGTAPFYRLLNPQSGDHFYTLSSVERDNAIANLGYQTEGVACYAFDSQSAGSTPVFRLFNPQIGDHFYTTSSAERDNAIANVGYQTEGVACYGFDAPAPETTPLFRLLKIA
jgi:Common central domain of tyrosinase/Repeat of unknown function (DUF5648)